MPRNNPSKLSPEQRDKLIETRRANDACRGYEPSPTQKRCFESEARYRLLDGPNRGGKSAHLAYELAAAARRIHPTRSCSTNGVYLLMAPSREQLKDPWGKKLLTGSELMGPWRDKPFIPPWEIKKVWKTHGAGEPVPRDIVLKNGNKILLAVSGDDDIDKRLKGKMLLGVVLDEDAGTERLLAELYSRLLDANSDPKIQQEAGGGWILWGATDDEANEAFGNFQRLCRDDTHPDHDEFTIDPAESRAVTVTEREKLRGVIDDETYAIKHLGSDGARSTKLIFQHWSREKHIRTSPYVDNLDDTLWISYDPGWRHPCGILCASINRAEPNKIRVVRFYSYKYGTRSDHAHSMAEWLDGRVLEGLVCDPAILRTESNGKSYFSLFEEELPSMGVRMRRPLMTGRNRIEDMFPTMESYFEQGLVEVDPHGDGCPTFIHQIEAYKWHPKQEGRTVYKRKDEAPDTLKYLISKFPCWIDAGANPRSGATAPQIIQLNEELVERPEMSNEDRIHLLRLHQSATTIDDLDDSWVTPIGIASGW